MSQNLIYRVVLAEDDVDDAFLFTQALNQSRHIAALKIVKDGEKLLEYLSRLSEEELPHLIFLDLHMPKRNGIECIRVLRGDKRFNTIPIIMFTSSGLPPDIEASTKFGANMYIRKSDSFKTLTGILDGLFTNNGYEYLLLKQSNQIS